jgi:sulfite reductase alpha subunit-like flavoprotein
MRELITPLKDDGELNRHCLHASIDIKGSSFRYETGDHIAIWPENSDGEVTRLGRVLGLCKEVEIPILDENGEESGLHKMMKLDQVITVTPKDGK